MTDSHFVQNLTTYRNYLKYFAWAPRLPQNYFYILWQCSEKSSTLKYFWTSMGPIPKTNFCKIRNVEKMLKLTILCYNTRYKITSLKCISYCSWCKEHGRYDGSSVLNGLAKISVPSMLHLDTKIKVSWILFKIISMERNTLQAYSLKIFYISVKSLKSYQS